MTEPTTKPAASADRSDTDHRSAADIVAGLSTEEKLRLTSGRDFWHLEALESAGLDAVMITDGPHGLRKQTGDAKAGIADSVPATCFPVAVSLASTWDLDLVEEVGRALGREAAAEKVSLVLGPGLNLKRHPYGGRNFEYFSEDPLASGRLAGALVNGIQSQGVGACIKHFAANNQETRRMTVDTVIDERTLRELYLTGFEIAVRESAPWSVMTAYNRINGTYASDARWLLTDILRDEWGFDGFVVSDWGGTGTRAPALAAGLDLEMPGNNHVWDGEVLAALEDGTLDPAALDAAAANLVDFMLRATRHRTVSSAGTSGRAPTSNHGAVDVDGHHDLARRAAAAGSVLLTNDGTLPLDRARFGPSRSLAVIGSLADKPRFQGAGSSLVHATRVDTILSALSERTDVTYAAAYDPENGDTSTELLSEAVEVAAKAEVAVVVVGLPPKFESEGFDRTTLSLPESHDALVNAVVATGTPTVVVLVNGAPVDVPWADRPAAIIETYLGGQAAGSAIADVLLGDTEPGGRLSESFPVAVTDLPAHTNFPGEGRQVAYRETFHVGYRFHDTVGVPARFPFGHGLSYTSFDWGEVQVSGHGTELTVSVAITNTGDRVGSDVVQVYVRDPESSVPKPQKELKGFDKVHLAPGETAVATVLLGRRSFAHFQPGAGWVVEAGVFELVVARSSVDVHQVVEVHLDSDDAVETVAATVAPLATNAEFAALLGGAVPEPEPIRPFHRNSTLAEIGETRMGHAVKVGAIRAAKQRLGTTEDESMNRMIDAMLAELPLRGLTGMSGQLPPAALDRLIAALNADWRALVRGDWDQNTDQNSDR